MIDRILGDKYKKLYSLVSGILLFFVSVVYFLLECNMLYTTFNFIFKHFGNELPSKDKIVFSTFSYQYICIALIFLIFFLISLKSIKLLLKISQYGTFAVFLYILFISVSFYRNISENGSIAEIE
jgi:amino acid transporter